MAAKENEMTEKETRMQQFRDITSAAIEQAISCRIENGMTRREASRDLVRCMLRAFSGDPRSVQ